MTPLGFKGLDIRSRPLTFQLRVVALWPLVDPLKRQIVRTKCLRVY